MDAYSNDFHKIFLAQNPCDCNLLSCTHLGTTWYIATASQIGRFYLRTSKTPQKSLK